MFYSGANAWRCTDKTINVFNHVQSKKDNYSYYVKGISVLERALKHLPLQSLVLKAPRAPSVVHPACPSVQCVSLHNSFHRTSAMCKLRSSG